MLLLVGRALAWVFPRKVLSNSAIIALCERLYLTLTFAVKALKPGGLYLEHHLPYGLGFLSSP